MINEAGKSLWSAQCEDFRTTTVTSVTKIIKNMPLFKTLSGGELDEIVKISENIITGDNGIVDYLSIIDKADSSVYRHSMTVGSIAGMIGKWIGDVNLHELILAGFFHDIGKTRIPVGILNKPGKLNQYEWKIIKQHPCIGVELLQSAAGLSEVVLQGIYQHHERMDGSGYPCGLCDQEIMLIAKIISIADIYDAMTSDRSYRAAETPFQALETIHSEMGDKLEPQLCNLFIAKAQEVFTGATVRLSDGSEAKIATIDEKAFTKPVLRNSQGHYVDLAQRNDLTIIGIA